ncbi:MAG: carbonic anhydrase, partial [Gallionellales bacterium CG_4_8_14_3_um_filter_54_18]
VIAVMFEEGAANAELAKAWQAMPEEEGKSAKLSENVLGTAVMPESTAYYRFSGSLTTPPCSEGVIWLVMKQPVTASKEQIEKFAHAMHHPNNRPVQPTNARLILE